MCGFYRWPCRKHTPLQLPQSKMEQMLRNRIAEQEETLRQRKAAKKQRRGVATESLSDMSPVSGATPSPPPSPPLTRRGRQFYGILTTVGQFCQLLGIIWWLQAMCVITPAPLPRVPTHPPRSDPRPRAGTPATACTAPASPRPPR